MWPSSGVNRLGAPGGETDGQGRAEGTGEAGGSSCQGSGYPLFPIRPRCPAKGSPVLAPADPRLQPTGGVQEGSLQQDLNPTQLHPRQGTEGVNHPGPLSSWAASPLWPPSDVGHSAWPFLREGCARSLALSLSLSLLPSSPSSYPRGLGETPVHQGGCPPRRATAPVTRSHLSLYLINRGLRIEACN